MPSRPLILSGESEQILASTARSIWICPCHDGAAREFNELPEREQFDVWSDLTGNEAKAKAQGLMTESPQVVHDALAQLNVELHKLTQLDGTPENQGGVALQMAIQRYPVFVNDPVFRLKFLRAEKFDAHAAAGRMALHFETKLELWGVERLGREIFLSDFDEDDLDTLRRGFFQVLNQLDQSGRRILFYYKALSSCYRKRENILRTVWYFTNAISNDERVQLLGVVNVVYNNGGFPEGGMDYEKSRRLAKLFRGIPIRFDSFYVCLDEKPWQGVVEVFSFMVGKFIRVRMRSIQGSQTECLYQLMALGIPYDALPVAAANQLVTRDYLRSLDRVFMEDEQRRTQWVPTSNLIEEE